MQVSALYFFSFLFSLPFKYSKITFTFFIKIHDWKGGRIRNARHGIGSRWNILRGQLGKAELRIKLKLVNTVFYGNHPCY